MRRAPWLSGSALKQRYFEFANESAIRADGVLRSLPFRRGTPHPRALSQATDRHQPPGSQQLNKADRNRSLPTHRGFRPRKELGRAIFRESSQPVGKRLSLRVRGIAKPAPHLRRGNELNQNSLTHNTSVPVERIVFD